MRNKHWRNVKLSSISEITFIVIFLTFMSSQTAHALSKNVRSGMLDFNLYPYLSDVSNDSVFTLNVAANLHQGFSYFSLTNIYNQHDESELQDTTSFYTEQNLRWQIYDSAFDLTGQFNFRSGENNDRHRLGFRWRLNNSNTLKSLFDRLNLAWSINIHLLQIDDTDDNEWQMEHVFRWKAPQLSKRLYIAGFIDHTFNEELPENIPNNSIISEIQVGYRLIENLHVVLENRINQYRRSDVNNTAAGIQYTLIW